MLSDKLFSLRRHCGMSEQDVASAIGVTRQTISNWEQNQGSPTLDKAAALASLYGLSLDDLVSDEVDVVSSGSSGRAPDLHVLSAFVRAKDACISLACAECCISNADILEADKDWLRVSVVQKPAAFGKPKADEKRAVRLIDVGDVLGISANMPTASATQTPEKW